MSFSTILCGHLRPAGASARLPSPRRKAKKSIVAKRTRERLHTQTRTNEKSSTYFRREFQSFGWREESSFFPILYYNIFYLMLSKITRLAGQVARAKTMGQLLYSSCLLAAPDE